MTINMVSDVSELESDGHAAKPTPNSNMDASVLPSAHLLLHRVVRILRGCGISTSQLATLTEKVLKESDALPKAPLGTITAQQGLACCDVILKWRRECRFLDSDGQARLLPIDGPSPSFAELVSTAAPKANPLELLRTMVQLGVVRMADDSVVELISESVVACPGKEGTAIATDIVLEHVCGFLGSVEYNVFDKPSRARGKFERACYARVPRKYVPVLEQLVSNRGQEFVDVIDEWLARRATPASEGNESILVGAGVYVFAREGLGN
ncbi:MAG: hypothetical protein KF822_07310 [Steroidobacteraceae bacterium]|nr:hypothetical protein [Steroidobacteraceae bacterium]